MIRPNMLDDNTWPPCADRCDPWLDTGWCGHIAEQIRHGGDLAPIDTDFCVPYNPSSSLYATCKIGDEINPAKAPGLRRLYVVKKVPLVPSPHDREEIELALWSQGEGRASICLTVRDWVRGLAGSGHISCRFTRHGYRENMKMQGFTDAQWEINDFYCATESACWFCYHSTQSIDPGSLLDPDDGDVNSQRTRNQLRNR